jgi:hypothetical protein
VVKLRAEIAHVEITGARFTFEKMVNRASHHRLGTSDPKTKGNVERKSWERACCDRRQ